MIYKARQLNSYLNHLTLTGSDNGILEWIGKDLEWYKAEVDSLPKDAHELNESDDYDFKTMNK